MAIFISGALVQAKLRFTTFENNRTIYDFHECVIWLAPEYHLCHPIAYSFVIQAQPGEAHANSGAQAVALHKS